MQRSVSILDKLEVCHRHFGSHFVAWLTGVKSIPMPMTVKGFAFFGSLAETAAGKCFGHASWPPADHDLLKTLAYLETMVHGMR